MTTLKGDYRAEEIRVSPLTHRFTIFIITLLLQCHRADPNDRKMRILLRRYPGGMLTELPRRHTSFVLFFQNTQKKSHHVAHPGVDESTQVPSRTPDKIASLREGFSACRAVLAFNNALFMLLKKLQSNHLSEGGKGTPMTLNAHNTHNIHTTRTTLSLSVPLSPSITHFLSTLHPLFPSVLLSCLPNSS